MANRDITLFERVAPLYDRLLPAANTDSLQRGLDRATRPVERVLDVGGGTGRGVRALSTPQRIVVDPAERMLTQARCHGVDSVRGDGARLPISTDGVDAVIVVDALHHIADQAGVVEEAHRVIAPGGVLVICDFDPTTALGRLLVWGEHLVGFESTFHQPDRLREMLAGVGFEAGVVERGFGYTVVGRVPGYG